MADIECWVVYYNPSDFPGCYVTRPWVGFDPLAFAFVCWSLEQARSYIPPGCQTFSRWEDDDPAILEVWI